MIRPCMIHVKTAKPSIDSPFEIAGELRRDERTGKMSKRHETFFLIFRKKLTYQNNLIH